MSDISREDLGEIYAFAVQLGKDAGRMLMDTAQMRMGKGGAGERTEHVQKENAVDLVTETDEGVQSQILLRSLHCMM
jgi:myo-inositol-1(or 4)-monophosphatase